MNPLTQFDLSAVHKAYRDSTNILVIDRPSFGGGKQAVVLFSSNGLYFPNTEEEATRVLFDQNRFEWSRTLPLNCRRVVLVRDVYKTWYLNGTSSQIHNPLALAEYLKRLLAGWDIQMAGVSSGGFAAILFGCLVGARRVFSLAGQFSLSFILDDEKEHGLNPEVLKASISSSMRSFLDVRHHFAGSTPEIFYVVPVRSQVDQIQYRIAADDPLIHTLAINSDLHGANLLSPALRRLFSRSSNYLIHLKRLTPSAGWDYVELSRRISGNRRHLAYLLRYRRDLIRFKPTFST